MCASGTSPAPELISGQHMRSSRFQARTTQFEAEGAESTPESISGQRLKSSRVQASTTRIGADRAGGGSRPGEMTPPCESGTGPLLRHFEESTTRFETDMTRF